MALEAAEDDKGSCFSTKCAYCVTCLCKKRQKYFLKRRRTKKLSALLYSETLLICFYYLLQSIVSNGYVTTDAQLYSNLKNGKNLSRHLTEDILTSFNNYEELEDINEFKRNVIFHKGKIINIRL